MVISKGLDDKSPSPIIATEAAPVPQQRGAEERNAESSKTEKKSAKFKLSVLMLCMVVFVVAMDSVIVAAALPAIADSLRGSSLETFWVGTSYLLAQTVRISPLSE